MPTPSTTTPDPDVQTARTPTPAPASNRATGRHTNRAICIDFEGRLHEPPVLLGVLHHERYRVYVLDPTLAPLVRRVIIPGVSVYLRTLAQAVDEVLAMATAGGGDRRIVAFSLHELTMIERHVGRPAAELVAARYLNARKFFAAWLHGTRPDLNVEELSLDHCTEALGYAWPDAEPFSPADAIRRLREQLATARRYRRHPGARTEALWRALIAYNREDCRATRFLTRATAILRAGGSLPAGEVRNDRRTGRGDWAFTPARGR